MQKKLAAKTIHTTVKMHGQLVTWSVSHMVNWSHSQFITMPLYTMVNSSHDFRRF